MHGEMLTYGLKRGTQNELLHIDKVHNGLGCDCVCPHCKHELIARNRGTKRIPHFAHASGSDCGGGRMTALHMLAQQIIESGKKIMLPDYIGEYYQKETVLTEFDEVTLEQRTKLDDKLSRPDCIGIKYDKDGLTHKLLIEIRVTHKVDEQKQRLIRDAGIACIEIDLSDMLYTDYTEESVKQRLLEGKDDRVWICCPIYDAKNEANMAEAKQKEEELRKIVEKEEEMFKKIAEEERNKRIEEGRRFEENRLRHQAESRNQNKMVSTPTYRAWQEPEFKPPIIPLDKKDHIIQAVHGQSIIPTNENYSPELAEKFNKPYQES
jgi:hypothetical protein